MMDELIAENGEVNGTVEYLGKVDGKWLAVPATVGSQIKGPCSRIDLMKQHAGIDVQAMYPAGARAEGRRLDLDTFLKAAEACHKAGYPFGIGLGTTTDIVDTVGAIFHAFGAELVDAKGNITVKSDAVRQALEYYKKLDGVPAARRAGLGRRLEQQVAGLGPGRADHESAERLGGRQARRAEGRRAVLDARLPGRPEGPLRAVPAVLLGHLELLEEQAGGQEPAARICRSATSVEKMVAASGGYDLPAFEKLTDLQDLGRGGAAQGHALPLPEPAQPPDAVDRRRAGAAARSPSRSTPRRIMTKMVVRYMQGEAMEKTLAWARERGRRLHADLSRVDGSSTRRAADAGASHAGGDVPLDRRHGDAGSNRLGSSDRWPTSPSHDVDAASAHARAQPQQPAAS